jgi:hypothetical protein
MNSQTTVTTAAASIAAAKIAILFVLLYQYSFATTAV